MSRLGGAALGPGGELIDIRAFRGNLKNATTKVVYEASHLKWFV